MTNLAGMFLRMATSSTAKTPQSAGTEVQYMVKFCQGKCGGIQTPHICKPGYLECAWCFNKVYETSLSTGQDKHPG